MILGQTFVLPTRHSRVASLEIVRTCRAQFKIGQTVFLERSLAAPGGAYVITKRLPERDGEFEYRIKSINEPHERVVRESQLNTEL